jgi:hypothetical protein
MKLDFLLDEGRVVTRVTLSEANVRSLYHKLTMPGSARTLLKDVDENHRVIVTVERDDVHYRSEPRGLMHPETEAFLERRTGGPCAPTCASTVDGECNC